MIDAQLAALLAGLDDATLADLVDGLPEHIVAALAAASPRGPGSVPSTPLAQALALDEGFRVVPHLSYLSNRLAAAAADVEGGRSRFLIVSMPPRMGKSYLSSIYLPLWLLHRHPDWRIGLISHSPSLATSWGRQVRRWVEKRGTELGGLAIARDAGAVSEWQTTSRGGVVSRSLPGQSITGLGFKVLLVDDPHKDFATSHSQLFRDSIWDWWIANAYTRLEHPALVVVTATRWHAEDLIGRLLSPEYDGDPGAWEQIVFPALATSDDALGRAPGEPLLSPLMDESPEQAGARWGSIRAAVGEYVWSALYQQSPAPPGGVIFDVGAFRFWTFDPALADEHGAVLLTPDQLARGEWVDSWDTSFKGGADSDYVVAQRWVRLGPVKVLIDQARGRWSYTEAIAVMRRWGRPEGLGGRFVSTRLVEDSANGPAIIDSLKDEIPGLRPWRARGSKESRYRAVTPDVERGEVLLPHPAQPGCAWVHGLLDELREAPNGANDDQADALAQALLYYGASPPGALTIPTTNVDRPDAASQAWSAAAPRRPVPAGTPSWSGRIVAPPPVVPSYGPPRRAGEPGNRSPWAR